MIELPSQFRLEPRRVRQVAGAHVLLEGAASLDRAQLALFMPYRPVVGDVVLVIDDGHARYVVGVLTRHGELDLVSDRGVTVKSRRKLRLEGERGVRVLGQALELVASGAIVVRAGQLLQRFDSARRHVQKRFVRVAGDADELVHGGWLMTVGRATLAVREAFRINGKVIRTG